MNCMWIFCKGYVLSIDYKHVIIFLEDFWHNFIVYAKKVTQFKLTNDD